MGSEPHSDRHQWHCLSCLTLKVRKKKKVERQGRTKGKKTKTKNQKTQTWGKGWMLCIRAKDTLKKKNSSGCVLVRQRRRRRYQVKMPNDETDGGGGRGGGCCCGAGSPRCWWSHRPPNGPIIIWTTHRCMCVSVQWYQHIGPSVYESISWRSRANGLSWLRGQLSVDRLKSLFPQARLCL